MNTMLRVYRAADRIDRLTEIKRQKEKDAEFIRNRNAAASTLKPI